MSTKIKVVFLLSLILLSSCGSSEKYDNYDYSDNLDEPETTLSYDINTELTEPEDTTTVSENIDDDLALGYEILQKEEVIPKRIEYLSRDELLLVIDQNENYYVSDLFGCCYTKEYALQNNITSNQLHEFGNRLYNQFDDDCTDMFITDPNHQTIINCQNLQDYDLVWVREYKETVNSSEIIFNAYDNSGQLKHSISSELLTSLNKYDLENLTFEFDEEHNVYYAYSSARDSILVLNLETNESFWTTTKFSDGFALYNNNFVDLHGNKTSIADTLNLKNCKASNLSEGLVFISGKKKEDDSNLYAFYNKQFEKIIDLSEYNVSQVSGFKDGYCTIRAYNDNKTSFYGIIDMSGHFVYDFQDIYEFDHVHKISDQLLLFSATRKSDSQFVFILYDYLKEQIVNDRYQNINAKILLDNCVRNNLIIYDNAYYVENGQLYCYNFFSDTLDSIRMYLD